MLELVNVIGVASLQGAPTQGLRKFGVPPGGAFDQESLALANALLGNAPQTSAWEVVGTAEFKVPPHASIAVVGGRTRRSGATVHVSAIPPTFRAYVAFRGGALRRRKLADPPGSFAKGSIRILPGPQSNLLDLGAFLRGQYRIALSSDRVGMRLDGPAMPHALELTSEPACFGAIQVTNSGQPIILGPDGPTLGGYPKIAVVIRTDLDRLAQVAPGAPVSFREVTLDEAEALWRTRQTRLNAKLAEIALGLQAL